MVSRRSAKTGHTYLRFLAGGSKGNHFHVDIALAKIFPPGRKPEVTAKTSAILERLDEHKGQKLELLLVGRYILTADLDKLDGGLLFTGPRAVVPTVNDSTAIVTGARLEISNDKAIEFIQWDVFGREIVVDIHGQCNTEVSDAYMVDALQLIHEGFSTYILGGVGQ